jgi:hypothetical protein
MLLVPSFLEYQVKTMMQPGCYAMQALYLFQSNSTLNITFSSHHIYCHSQLEFDVDSEIAVHFPSDLSPQESTLLCGGGRAGQDLCAGGWEDDARVLLLHTYPVVPQVWVLEWLWDTGKHSGVVFLNVKWWYMCKHFCSLSVRHPGTPVCCQY